MTRDIIKIKLTKEYKEKALQIINDTIENVYSKYNVTLTETDKRKIKNLTLDQVNINVSIKAKTKTFWIFDTENCLPVVVETEENKPSMGQLVATKIQTGFYVIKPNLVWTFVKKNVDGTGLNKKKFEEKVLEMLLEDFQTSAFYGALSYVTKSDYNA